MTDKQPMQANGDDGREDAPDGVENPGGKTGGGESGGGAYPNPRDGEHSGEGGFLGHGGQSEIGYSGTGDDDGEDNANAAAGTK